MQALAQIKQGDPSGALRSVDGLRPVTVQGRLAQALTLCGAAVMGFADPELGTAKAAECRRLALESGDRAALVVASWAQAAAAHARGDLRRSIWADLHDTAALRELAISVFDGHLCITQRLLYGARPYSDVVAFADAFIAEAQRLGAARGHAFAVTLRGQAKLLSGSLDEADEDLQEAARLSRAIGAPVGEALALQRRAEVALYRGHARAAGRLLDEALAVARESDIGFHLLDRIYGTKITAAADPAAALAALDEAEAAVRGPLETCPGCRITLTVPAAIAAARAGDLDRARRHAEHGRDSPASSCGCPVGTPRWRRSGAISRSPMETPSVPPTRSGRRRTASTAQASPSTKPAAPPWPAARPDSESTIGGHRSTHTRRPPFGPLRPQVGGPEEPPLRPPRAPPPPLATRRAGDGRAGLVLRTCARRHAGLFDHPVRSGSVTGLPSSTQALNPPSRCATS